MTSEEIGVNVEGGTDKSYGIQVARLAGVPKSVLERAKQILSNLEESELTPEGNVRQPRKQQDRDKLKKHRALAAGGFVWMNEQSLNQLSEQFGSILRRARIITTWPLSERDMLPLVINREVRFGFDEVTKNDFEDLLSKLLKNHKWSEKYSERFLANQLLDVIAKLIKANQPDLLRSYFEQIVNDYENFSTESIVFIPLGGIALKLPSFEIGNITIRKVLRDETSEPFARIDPHIETSWTIQHAKMKSIFLEMILPPKLFALNFGRLLNPSARKRGPSKNVIAY